MEYEYDDIKRDIVDKVMHKTYGYDLKELITKNLRNVNPVIDNPFDASTKKLIFLPPIERICNDVFSAIKEVKSKDNDLWHAAILASKLYESFTIYWREDLLANGKDVLGISLWTQVLNITKNWEDADADGMKIHKGTPYFFLGENYLLLGDRELASLQLHNALIDDFKLGELDKLSGYPDRAPAFFTATMREYSNNHLNPFVRELREYLERYIKVFQNEYDKNFTIEMFDQNFLGKKQFSDYVVFFISNWMYLYTLSKNIPMGQTDNDYSRLKALDTIFNLCLIIDEILKVYWKKVRRRRKLLKNHQIRHGIAVLSHKKGWMAQNDIECFWGKLKVMDTPPDKMVPILLKMKRRFKKGSNMILPRKEIFTMLLAYNLRNYGGHNIKQQKILTEKYKEIISQLMMALFLSVRAL